MVRGIFKMHIMVSWGLGEPKVPQCLLASANKVKWYLNTSNLRNTNYSNHEKLYRVKQNWKRWLAFQKQSTAEVK